VVLVLLLHTRSQRQCAPDKETRSILKHREHFRDQLCVGETRWHWPPRLPDAAFVTFRLREFVFGFRLLLSSNQISGSCRKAFPEKKKPQHDKLGPCRRNQC